MLNLLVLALILTGLLYFYNNNQGRILDNFQYILAFIGFAVGISLVYKFLLPPGTAPPSVLRMVGLGGADNGPNGQQVVPCYSVPFKVVASQYGDRAVLAGYNENVEAAEQGAEGKYEDPKSIPLQGDCIQVAYDVIPIKSSK